MEDLVLKDKKLCECGCGELIPKINKMHKPARFKQGHQARVMNIGFGRGEGHYAWKGGIRKDSSGYVLRWVPKHHFATKEGYVVEHRLVWEKANNAILLPWADVHHMNGIVNDNRIENLEAMTHGQHMRYHRRYHT